MSNQEQDTQSIRRLELEVMRKLRESHKWLVIKCRESSSRKGWSAKVTSASDGSYKYLSATNLTRLLEKLNGHLRMEGKSDG